MLSHIHQVLTWFAKDLLIRVRYRIMGNPNGGLLFNSDGPESQGCSLPFDVSSACEFPTVILAEDVFVTRVDWCKMTHKPFHEFLVFHVSERQRSDGETSRKSIIVLDRRVADDKAPIEDRENDSGSMDESTLAEPLELAFMENGKATSTPWIPSLPQSKTVYRSQSSSSKKLKAGDKLYFSLDGSLAFLNNHPWLYHEICKKLVIKGDYISVIQLAVLARTVHSHHRGYDLWCYQCYWYAEIVYSTIKMIIQKAPGYTTSCRWSEPNVNASLPVGNYKWSNGITTTVTPSNPKLHKAIYQKYLTAWEQMKDVIAKEGKKRQTKARDQCEPEIQAALQRAKDAEDQLAKEKAKWEAANEEIRKLKEQHARQ